jgi:hypothetical protein
MVEREGLFVRRSKKSMIPKSHIYESLTPL